MAVDSGTLHRLRSLASLWLARHPRLAAASFIALTCVLAFGLRCLHLLRHDHYFIMSADSYYFHRMAELVVLDEKYFYPTHNQVLPISMSAGIVYPLGFAARLIALIGNASSLDALEFASKVIPPILGVAMVLTIYFAVWRLYGRSISFMSAFLWAVLPMAVFIQGAGNLDRDCLSILLVAGGVFLFYFLKDWRFKVGRRESGWVVCALGVVAIEALLYIEWGFFGPGILLVIITSFYCLGVLNGVITRLLPALSADEDIMKTAVIAARKTPQSLLAALRESAYAPMAVILGVSLVAAASRAGTFPEIQHYAMKALRAAAFGGETTSELQGIAVFDIISYWPVLVPIGVGMYVLLKRRGQADLLLLGWLVVLGVAGLFARRFLVYATPAIVMTSAVGFVSMLNPRGLRQSLYSLYAAFATMRPPRASSIAPSLRVGLGILLILLTFGLSTAGAYSVASTSAGAVSPDTEWYDALSWLRENTPDEAVIMVRWDFGYWILDVAHRVPVVDNGMHPEATDKDIERLYTTTDDSEAAAVMAEYGASYVVFSRAGDQPLFPEPVDSLYNRSFSDDFRSDYGWRRVYPAADINEPEVLILALG